MCTSKHNTCLFILIICVHSIYFSINNNKKKEQHKVCAEHNQTNLFCNQDNIYLLESFSNAERWVSEQIKHSSNSWKTH